MALDMASSIIGLLAFAQLDYWAGKSLVIGLAVVATLGVTATKYVVRGEVHWILVLFWMLCMGIDIVTNLFSLAHFVIEGKTVQELVITNFHQLREIVQSNPSRSLIALAIMAIITTGTIGGAYCLDSLQKQTSGNPVA